jgi:hypothetical protein
MKLSVFVDFEDISNISIVDPQNTIIRPVNEMVCPLVCRCTRQYKIPYHCVNHQDEQT